MKITERIEVDSPTERVWDFIVDPHKMSSCLPAVQSVEVLDDRHYKAVVKQKIGFISATFEIRTEVLEQKKPYRLMLANQGKTILGANGTLRSQDTITLTPVSENRTSISVESDLKLGGRLAILGAKLIESKSKEIFAEVAANLKKKLSANSNDQDHPAGVWRRWKLGRLVILVLKTMEGLMPWV